MRTIISNEFAGTRIKIAVLGEPLLTKNLFQKFCRLGSSEMLDSLGEMYSSIRKVEIIIDSIDHGEGSNIYRFHMLASEQDEPKSISRTLPLHNPQFVIYVYDPTDPEGLTKIKGWIDEIKQYNLVDGTYIPILIANKVDFGKDVVIEERQMKQFVVDNGLQRMQDYQIDASQTVEDVGEKDTDIENIIRHAIETKLASLRIQLESLDQQQLRKDKDELVAKRRRRSEEHQRELAARPSEQVQSTKNIETELLRQLCNFLKRHGVTKIEIAPDPGKATLFGWGPAVNKGKPAFRFYFTNEASAKKYSEYIAAATQADGSRISKGTLSRFDKTMMVASEEGARRIFTSYNAGGIFSQLILGYTSAQFSKPDLVLSSDFSSSASSTPSSSGGKS